MNFTRELKIFIKKEPFYIILIIFILSINMLLLLSSLGKEAVPKELPEKISKIRELAEDRAKLEKAILENKKMATIATLFALGAILSIFIGLILDFIIFIRQRSPGDLLERSLSPPTISWSVWDALKVVILFLSFGYLIAIAEAAVIAPIFPAIKSNERIISIVNTTLLDIIAVSMVFYFTISTYRHRIQDLGLTVKNFFKNISYGVLAYISVIPFLIIALIVTVFFTNLFKYRPAPQPILEIFMKEEKQTILAYMTLFVAVVGPVMEEIFFRGFLYNAIKKETGVRWAILISACLFSFLHAHVVGILPILVLGILLAYLYEKTGSLVSSITVHIIHNLIMVLLIFFIKGMTF